MLWVTGGGTQHFWCSVLWQELSTICVVLVSFFCQLSHKQYDFKMVAHKPNGEISSVIAVLFYKIDAVC